MTRTQNTFGLIGAVLVSTLLASGSAFAAEPMPQGYQLASAKVAGEGKCGEGKCGAHADAKAGKAEGKCGEGKCGAQADAKATKAEGKCGEGKCGNDKP